MNPHFFMDSERFLKKFGKFAIAKPLRTG